MMTIMVAVMAVMMVVAEAHPRSTVTHRKGGSPLADAIALPPLQGY